MPKISNALLKYRNDKKFVSRHLIAWLCLYLLFVLIDLIIEKDLPFRYSTLGYLALAVVTIMFIFYVHFFICEWLFSKKIPFFSMVLLCFLLFLGIRYIQEINRTDEPRPGIFLLIFLSSLYYFIVIVFSTLAWSLKTSSENRKESLKTRYRLEQSNNELQQKNLLLQNQLLSTEIKFLRAQINPHFLFNSLNFFYSEMLPSNPRTADGIMTLSQIMRYSLQDFSKNEGLANLQDELEHIENVIKIHQMRFDNVLNIATDLKCSDANIKIIPMVFITLVENVFKYAHLHDPENPAVIICKTDQVNKIIYFSTANKKKKGDHSGQSSGIGLSNIEQRLNQFYNTRFSLAVDDRPGFYKVELKIPFQAETQKML